MSCNRAATELWGADGFVYRLHHAGTHFEKHSRAHTYTSISNTYCSMRPSSILFFFKALASLPVLSHGLDRYFAAYLHAFKRVEQLLRLRLQLLSLSDGLGQLRRQTVHL